MVWDCIAGSVKGGCLNLQGTKSWSELMDFSTNIDPKQIKITEIC